MSWSGVESGPPMLSEGRVQGRRDGGRYDDSFTIGILFR